MRRTNFCSRRIRRWCTSNVLTVLAVHDSHRLLRRVPGILIVFGILLSGLTLIELNSHALPVAAADGTVSGRVFQDLDVDGMIDTGEGGAASATVKAYDVTGALVGTATTAGDGTYTLTVTGASTTAVRVEFDLDRWSPSFFGPDNGGNVQFVETGATNVNYGVQQPGQYCANNDITEGMRLAVATMVPGGIQTGSGLPQTGADVMGNCYRQSVSTYPWDGPTPEFEDGTYVNQRAQTQLTVNKDTGALFGLGFDGATNLLWGSAVIRRHSGLGPEGVGGVYAMHTTGSGVAASFDLTQAPWNLTFSDGRNLSDAARDLSTNPNMNLAYSSDVPGYSAVGKIGIGELEVDPEGGYLWIVNLYEKKLHRIVLTGSADTPGLGAVTSYTIPQSVCTFNGSVARPFALRLDPTTGQPLVGGVCTNEGAAVGSASTPENGWAMSLDPTSSAFTTLTTFSFDYPHYDDSCDGTEAATEHPLKSTAIDIDQCLPSVWKGWTDDFDAIQTWTNSIKGSTADGINFAGRYSQPMLTGLDVLADGSFVVGVADRMNFQTGWFNAPPDATKGSGSSMQFQVAAGVSGDILLLCKTGGTYVRETDGGCGSLQAASRPYAGPAAVDGLREFFDDNIFGITATPYSSGSAAHIETSNGAVQVWPRSGTQQVAFTAMDPAGEFNAGGIRWVSATAGNAISGVDVTSPRINGSANNPPLYETSSFAKNANMGGLEILCDMAPAEIGNRVWIDTDLDGLQDPGEPVAAGVTVRLYDAEGTLLGTTVTDAQGRYYFRSTVTESATGTGDNIGPLPLRTAVQIRFDNPADYASGGPLHTYGATLNGVASAGGTLAGASNSDAVQTGTYPHIDVPTVSAGTVEHTYDAGFVPVRSVGSRAWIDADQDGIQDEGEGGLGGVLVELLNPNGTPALTISGVTASAVTNPDGTYVLSGLAPGDYKIRFTPPTGIPMTTQTAAGSTSANDSNADPATGMTGVFTLGATATGDTVAPSDPSHLLGVFSNPTIDVGVIAPPVGFGDWVWWDPLGTGDQFDSDGPIQGVKVELFRPDGQPAVDFDGNPVEPQYTDKYGEYYFTNLLPGQYKAKFTAPSFYVPTARFTRDNGGFAVNQAEDSNIDSQGWSDVFTIGARAGGDTEENDWFDDAEFMNFTIDAGYTAPNLPVVALGDFVWFDSNKNGIQDQGEPPIEGMWVGLYDVNGNPARDKDGNDVPWQQTDTDGKYLFDDLMPGAYRVLFWKDGYRPTTQTVAGASPGVDSNPSTIDEDVCCGDWGYLTPLQMVDGRVSGDTIADTDPNTAATFVNPTIDAGFVPLEVAVGNYTWIDSNGDGVQDQGEPALSRVKVELFDGNGDPAVDAFGNPVPPVFTNANGYYLFDGLSPGDYMIKFTPPTGYDFTSQYSGLFDDDSDASPANGWTDVFTIDPRVAGDTVADTDPATTALFVNPTIDAGFVFIGFPFVPPPPPAPAPAPTPAPPSGSSARVTVGGYIWLDRNLNGLQDTGEIPLTGVLLELRDMAGRPVVDVSGNPVGPRTTLANGEYLFEGLPPGQYRVLITYPNWFGPTRAGVAGGVNDSHSFTADSRVLAAGQSDLTLDFGLVWKRTLPVTGGDHGWALGGFVFIGLGAVMLLLSARRRRWMV